AILSHHGEEGALTPLVERLADWRDRRIAAAMACGSLGQADRLKRLLLDRNVMVRLHTEALGDPAALYELSIYAHLFTQEISQGFVDPAGGLAVVAEEEIFGLRARRRVRQRRGGPPLTPGVFGRKKSDPLVPTHIRVPPESRRAQRRVPGVSRAFFPPPSAGRARRGL